MQATSQAEIVCGVTCACAPTTSNSGAAATKSGAPCAAHEACAYAREGKCSCAGGECRAAKEGCQQAVSRAFEDLGQEQDEELMLVLALAYREAVIVPRERARPSRRRLRPRSMPSGGFTHR